MAHRDKFLGKLTDGNTLGGGGSWVTTINGLSWAVILAAWTNISLPTVGNTITIDASGWATPAVPFNSVQFNNGGVFWGSADFIYDPTALNGIFKMGFSSNIMMQADEAAGIVTLGDVTGLLGNTKLFVDDVQNQIQITGNFIQTTGKKSGFNGASITDIDGEIFDLSINNVLTVTSATTNVAGVGNYVEFDPVADTPFGGTGIYTKFEVPSTNSKIFNGALPWLNAAWFQSAATYLMVYAGTSTTNANYAFSGVWFSLANDNSGNIPYGIGISGTVYNNQDGTIDLAGWSNVEISNTSGSVVGIIDIWYGYVANFNNTIGIMNSVIGFVTRYTNDGIGAIGDVKHMWMMTPINSGGGTYNNIYGLYIDDQSGIALGDGFNIFSRWANSQNILEGTLTMGDMTTPWAFYTFAIGDGLAGQVQVTDGAGTMTRQTVWTIFADNETPTGTVNGINDTFTLANTPSPAASLQLFVNGVLQKAGGVDYTLTGLTIVFAAGAIPLTGSILIAYYRY